MADDLRLAIQAAPLFRVAFPSSMTHQSLPRGIAEFMQGREDLVIELVAGSTMRLQVRYWIAASTLPSWVCRQNCQASTSCLCWRKACLPIPQRHALCEKQLINVIDLRGVADAKKLRRLKIAGYGCMKRRENESIAELGILSLSKKKVLT